MRRRSDEQLLAAVEKDPGAFGEFYERHEQDVLRFFMHWTLSPEVAADLMAETFAVAFESIARYQRARGEPRAWLFGIAKNLLARSIRRGRVEDDTRRRLGLTPLLVDDTAIDQINALGTAAGALGGLSALLGEAVTGRVLEDRDYREMAAALQCSESVLRQRVRRGLAQIRDQLEASE